MCCMYARFDFEAVNGERIPDYLSGAVGMYVVPTPSRAPWAPPCGNPRWWCTSLAGSQNSLATAWTGACLPLNSSTFFQPVLMAPFLVLINTSFELGLLQEIKAAVELKFERSPRSSVMPELKFERSPRSSAMPRLRGEEDQILVPEVAVKVIYSFSAIIYSISLKLSGLDSNTYT
jgi:hypothetical protein